MNVFDFHSYTAYLKAAFDHPGAEKGMRSRLAKALGCQTSFVSQVMSGRLHFSLEHGLTITQFLRLNAAETQYFLMLLQKAKAGSMALQNYFDNEIAGLRKKRELIKERIEVHGELSEKDQIIYYSAWWYMAVHILVALPGLNTRSALIKRLNLPAKNIDRALRFLKQASLIVESNGVFKIGKTRIHLGTGSPFLPRHHVNWRIKAIEVAEKAHSQDLQYSALLGISRADGKKIRNLLLNLVQKTEPIIIKSKEEAPYVMLLDFFEL